LDESRPEHNPEHAGHHAAHHAQEEHPVHEKVQKHHVAPAHRRNIDLTPVRKKKKPVGKYIIGALVFVVLVAIVVVLIMFLSKQGEKRVSDDNAVAATINGETITVGYLNDQYSRVPAQYQSYITKSMLLNQTINEMILLQEAKKQGIEVTSADVKKEITTAMDKAGVTQDQLDERLKQQNVTMSFLEDLYKKQLTINKLLEKTVFPKLKVTEDDIQTYYDSRIHAAHILVDTEEEATAIIKDLGKVSKVKLEAKFNALASNKSKDPSAATNGGDLGEFGTGQMVPDFEKAAFALNEGEYTKTPVKTQFGYHVILRLPMNQTFEEEHGQISDYLLNDLKAKAVPMYLDQLRSKAQVEILYTEPVLPKTTVPISLPTDQGQ
jgi:foldase protein PrsA